MCAPHEVQDDDELAELNSARVVLVHDHDELVDVLALEGVFFCLPFRLELLVRSRRNRTSTSVWAKYALNRFREEEADT